MNFDDLPSLTWNYRKHREYGSSSLVVYHLRIFHKLLILSTLPTEMITSLTQGLYFIMNEFQAPD